MSEVSTKDCAKMVASDWKCAIDDRGGIKGLLTFLGTLMMVICMGFIAAFLPLWVPHMLIGDLTIGGSIMALVIYFIEVFIFVFIADVQKKCRKVNAK